MTIFKSCKQAGFESSSEFCGWYYLMSLHRSLHLQTRAVPALLHNRRRVFAIRVWVDPRQHSSHPFQFPGPFPSPSGCRSNYLQLV